MTTKAAFPAYFDSLPILAEEGSLSFVTDFQSDSTLTGATGQVYAKTGTYVTGSEAGTVLRGQALAGYIDAKSGQRLTFHLVVNNVNVSGLSDVIQVFQDEGTLSAILWRDN